MKATHACEGLTRADFGWRPVPCGKGATVEEKGKWYCKTHAPSVVKAKTAARHAKWEAKYDAKEAKWKAEEALSTATQRLVDAALSVPGPTSINLMMARKAYLAAKATLESLP